MKHKNLTELEIKKIADEISNLQYDSLHCLLLAIADKIELDATADKERNRPSLSKHLHNCAEHFYMASIEIEKAWKICKPYM